MIALLRLSAGLIGWAIAFCLVYALHGLGCSRGWDAVATVGGDLHRLALVGAWLVSLAATLVVALFLSRRRATVLDRAAIATGWTGFAATLVTFVPLVVVPACL